MRENVLYDYLKELNVIQYYELLFNVVLSRISFNFKIFILWSMHNAIVKET